MIIIHINHQLLPAGVGVRTSPPVEGGA